MKREDLKKLGVADDLIDSIMALHGADIEAHKAKVTTAEETVTNLQTQLETANKQIEQFKGMKIEEIQAAADDYKAKFEKAQADAATQLAQVKFDHAIDGALKDAKAKSPKAVKALLDLAGLKLADDGTVSGLTEQLEKIRTENDYLFDGDTKTPRIITKTNNQTVLNDAQMAAMRKAAGLTTPE
jgi:hypothetical protein